jgi:hypothetical protein
VLEIFSLKRGQEDVATAAIDLLPPSVSILASMGEKHFENSTKLEMFSRLERKLIE